MSRMRGRQYKKKYETAKLAGEKVRFKSGGFHKTTGTPEGKPIPKSKWRAALAGKYGAKGKSQASFGLALMGKTKEEFLG